MSRALAGLGAGIGTVVGGFAAGYVVNNVVSLRQDIADMTVLVSLIGGGIAGAMIGAGPSCAVPPRAGVAGVVGESPRMMHLPSHPRFP